MTPISYETAVSRAIQLKCPRCGEGDLFRGRFTMHECCSHCRLKYERAPGYFLGSTYINYGFVALTMTVAFIWLGMVLEVSPVILTPLLVAYFLFVPVLLFRHARSWWLAMDCYMDPIGFTEPEDLDAEYQALREQQGLGAEREADSQ